MAKQLCTERGYTGDERREGVCVEGGGAKQQPLLRKKRRAIVHLMKRGFSSRAMMRFVFCSTFYSRLPKPPQMSKTTTRPCSCTYPTTQGHLWSCPQNTTLCTRCNNTHRRPTAAVQHSLVAGYLVIVYILLLSILYLSRVVDQPVATLVSSSVCKGMGRSVGSRVCEGITLGIKREKTR